MCGIVGVVNKNRAQVDENQLVKMSDSLFHRRPDAGGLYVNKNIGFGH